ncbi:reverse transcriptase domain-containing protein [Tanacetum coccineum]
MATHTERMKRFENAIFKQHEEINGRMTEMFGLLKELTTSKAPKKVLIREEAKSPVTKSVNSISHHRRERKNDIYDVATSDDSKETDGPDMEVSVKEAETKNEAENGAKNKPIKKPKKEEVVEAPSSQPVEYYLKHRINEKLIDGLIDNNRFNDSLSGARGPAETDIRLSLASHSYIDPLGIAEDILVKTVKHVYPVDFVILDIKEDEKRPFVLGTPFLTMAKAVIKFDKGTITLRSGKSKISFHMIPESLGTIERGVNNDIYPIAPTMTVNRLVLEWEERIRLDFTKKRK